MPKASDDLSLHERIEAGQVFSHSERHLAVASGNTRDHIIQTNGKITHLISYTVSSDVAPGEVSLYEDASVSVEGTPAAIRNMNRNQQGKVTPTTKMFNNPTITDAGELLEATVISGTKQSGGAGEGVVSEWVLKPATNYLLRYINKSTGAADISTRMMFYEKKA